MDFLVSRKFSSRLRSERSSSFSCQRKRRSAVVLDDVPAGEDAGGVARCSGVGTGCCSRAGAVAGGGSGTTS